MANLRRPRRRVVKRKKPRNATYRRTRIYGTERSIIVNHSIVGSFPTGLTSSNYGWVYGNDYQLTLSKLISALPPQTREVKVRKVTMTVQTYMLPDVLSSTHSGSLQPATGTNLYWPPKWTFDTFKSLSETPTKYGIGILLLDHDDDTGDTNKYSDIAALQGACLPGNFKLGNEQTILRFKTVWTPQEPSETEWIGIKATGNSSKLFSFYVLGSNLDRKGWVTPDTASDGRKIGYLVQMKAHLIYRGKIQTTTVSPSVNLEDKLQTSSASGSFSLSSMQLND